MGCSSSKHMEILSPNLEDLSYDEETLQNLDWDINQREQIYRYDDFSNNTEKLLYGQHLNNLILKRMALIAHAKIDIFTKKIVELEGPCGDQEESKESS